MAAVILACVILTALIYRAIRPALSPVGII